ncbi:hypothetical protein C7T94_14565 [Pedobacter yulinensis]|uniref:HTH luxR-type domain-containing protein n=1 Tax=Pedobacter yulinensis TaxID=2126353 RepID=A0A2T3HHV3_9SPHI|nr:hypothetical protein C7T94_14565 [Pedobacter yulinensis]
MKAQQQTLDSLKRVIRAASAVDKPIKMAMLARATNESNPRSAHRTAQQALALARQQKNPDALAFCYATAGYIAMQQKHPGKARAWIDSAMLLAQKSKNDVIRSYAWLRKGWLELVNGNNDQSMTALLKGAQLAEQVNSPQAFSQQSLIHHYISSIYAYGSDTAKQRRYAIKCLATAFRSGSPDDIQIGMMTVAHSFFSKFERDVSQRRWLDSSKLAYRNAMDYYERNKAKIYIQTNASVTALNLANIYFKYHPRPYRDSAHVYINSALEIARRTKGHEVIANCYGMLSEYALMARQYNQAEQYLLKGLTELEPISSGADLTRSRLMQGLSRIAEQAGRYDRALAYYKKYQDYYTKVFDAEKLTTIQRMEAEFHASRQQDEIARLQELDKLNRRSFWLYLGIGSAGLLVLGFLLLSYHYKLKAAKRQEQLVEQQMQQAALQLKLHQTEADRLALEKQEAELKISLKEQERERLQAQQELLQDRTQWLERQLIAGVLKIEEKNAILDALRQRTQQTDNQVTARQIDQIVSQNQRLDEQQYELSQMHPDFFNQLQQKAGNSLTKLDLKYCSYILMGLETKEIAMRLGVEPKSIRMAKYRLKQKLGLGKEENLDVFIQSFQKPGRS